MRPVTARVNTANPIAYVRLDEFHGAAVAVQAVIEAALSGAAYQIDYTFEDPNDLVSPVPLASIVWDNALIPAAAQSALANATFAIATAPIWARVQLKAGATSVRVVFAQYEAYYARIAAAAAAPSVWALKANTSVTAVDNPVTPAINTSGATLLVVGTVFNSTPIPTLSDSKSNTWVGLVRQPFGGSSFTQIFYCAAPVVGAGHTFTLNGTGIYASLAVEAWSGSAAVPFDQQNSAQASGVTTSQPGSITPTVNGELLVTFISGLGITTTFTIGSGFTITDQQPGNPTYPGAMAYLVQATAAAINPTWTNSPSNGVTPVIASFKLGP